MILNNLLKILLFSPLLLISIEAKSQERNNKVESIEEIRMIGSSLGNVGCTKWNSIDIEKIQYFINNSRPSKRIAITSREDGQHFDYCKAIAKVRLSNKKTIDISINSNGDGIIQGKNYQCQTCAWIMEPTFLKSQSPFLEKAIYGDVFIIKSKNNDPCPSLVFNESRAAYFFKNSKPLRALDFPKNTQHNACEGIARLNSGGNFFQLMIFSEDPEHGIVFMEEDNSNGDRTPFFLKCSNCKKIFTPNFRPSKN